MLVAFCWPKKIGGFLRDFFRAGPLELGKVNVNFLLPPAIFSRKIFFSGEICSTLFFQESVFFTKDCDDCDPEKSQYILSKPKTKANRGWILDVSGAVCSCVMGTNHTD